MSAPLTAEVRAARYQSRAVARFMAKVWQPVAGECWLWTATLDRHGYGTFHYLGRNLGAHRVAFEFFRGPIPRGLHIDHLCRVPACVNPWHMEPVDQRTNTLRGNAPTALTFQMNRCKRGHEYTAANTIVKCGDPSKRQCRTCQNNARRSRYAEQRSA